MNNSEGFEGIKCGTTIMAVEYDGGVVLAADSRTTAGRNVVNSNTDKLSRITDKIYSGRCGSAAQSEQLLKFVTDNVDFYNLAYPDSMTVHMVATMFTNKIYEKRHVNQVGFIVAGWDKEQGGQVYNITPAGLMLRQRAAASGSGANSIRGLLMSRHTKNMPLNEAMELVKICTEIAISYDPFSGGHVKIAVINKDGLVMRRTIPISDTMFQLSSNMLWNLEFDACK
ncbi:proteasome subunit beta type-6-like [Drosophila sulfurigaster albostrigata]|uniref:proteasome subunit beta type-6-like n=1 Tax=Drosophila sulfurigaster albostrigata TaxID=89887 RepID=UPI002D21DAF3|nr:proteasome subunit beta type-6-like [Drosophila sulfurigaster albostrigata]